MTTFTGSRRVVMRLAAVLVALASMIGVMLFADPTPANANRSHLRAGCSWEGGVHGGVQRCKVYSPAMKRHITVQIQVAARGGSAGLYLLDGLRATERTNAWQWGEGQAPRTFRNDNVNLIMPVGGESSFYADWNAPARSNRGTKIYKWETFLTKELPDYLARNFGVSRTNNSIVGLSMGGSAALTLAAKHRNQFKQALSFSGYLHTTAPGMQSMIMLAQRDAGGFSGVDMYGAPYSKRWMENDPFYLTDKMRGLDIYISSNTGIPGKYDQPESLEQVYHTFNGIVLEGLSRASSLDFEAKARLSGLNPTVRYDSRGTHSWPYWRQELRDARPQILRVLGA
ncbi:alpha/beta hydrolase [Corynebacterium ulceribovis]|uniref:alpha/beta hydrolase n=1 Tax=Corynebacterium ulceribovis TaxID=487732 RepID=UPI00035C329D|nr:alpha/beta hydrolase family protein [Corynebacterium ulceribovis]